jgi:lipopolysaccharide transport system ATP-binding protein
VSSPRIGVVGTFDVENFGDLLFPLLTARELTERLPGAQLVLYSYREKRADDWPYAVRPLDRLPKDVARLDLLVVGGGFLVRFDKEIAPGYFPPDGTVEHPTGYWLMPTLLAAAYGVPVAWNSLSAATDTPEWATGLLALAVRSAGYVSIRDEPSRDELQRVAPGAPVELVADIGFGIDRLLPERPSDDFRRFAAESGLTEPYLILQPSPFLLEHTRQIDAAFAARRAAERAILELPISPALGDSPGLLELERRTVRPATWPSPLLLAEIISRADAVLARSLHLSVVALASGVPVHRHRSALDLKYEPLGLLPGVHYWEDRQDASAILEAGLGRREPGPEIDARLAELRTHWDRIASLVGTRPRAGPEVAAEVIALATAGLEALGARAARTEARLGEAERRLAELE